MGGGSFTPKDWAAYTASTTAGRTTAEVFSRSGMKPELDPKSITLRESRDSATNPAATALLVGLDVTGSMGIIADHIARDGLKTLFEAVYDRKPITDPQIAFAGIGDADCDSAPLQVSQFEADIRIAEQLTHLFLEHGGGGNNHESYTLPWYFCATRTAIDCFAKRGQKGYLFTVGDEEAPPTLTRAQIQKVFGTDEDAQDMTSEMLLAMVEREWHVFHVIVEQGNYARHRLDKVVSSWTALLGQRALRLADYTKLSEVIVSAIQVTQGADAADVATSWGGGTDVVVAKAIGALVPGRPADSNAIVAV